MMMKFATPFALAGALFLGACSSTDGILGMTDTSTTTAALPEKPKANPACAPLAAKIADLRKEGSVERIAQVSHGKGDTVAVKRASLAKVTELDRANAEFQAKCATVVIAPSAATVAAAAPAPAAPVAKATPAAKAAKQ